MSALSWLLNPPTPPEHKGRKVQNLRMGDSVGPYKLPPSRAAAPRRARVREELDAVLAALKANPGQSRGQLRDTLQWDEGHIKIRIEQLSKLGLIRYEPILTRRRGSSFMGVWHVAVSAAYGGGK